MGLCIDTPEKYLDLFHCMTAINFLLLGYSTIPRENLNSVILGEQL